jgi:cell volume regulation protein A
LFDGGLNIGLRRARTAAVPIVWVGVAGTAVTAGAMAFFAHVLFGFDWRLSLLLGTALAPTDPAVVFSVLGGKEIPGRSGTLLEGESGANDPVGIALMASILGTTGGGLHALGSGLREFLVEMVVGAAVGVLGGFLMRGAATRLPLPNAALHPLRALAFAGATYGGATVLHGSGFLAVLLAGIVVGDVDAPQDHDVERFAGAMSTLAEIVAFTVLGLTVDLRHALHADQLIPGVVLAALLILVVRPLLVGPLLLPVRLTAGERIFVLWAGLKGAVPIVLGTFLLVEHVPQATRLYEIIFVVVLISVVVQGGSVPYVTRLLKIDSTSPR